MPRSHLCLLLPLALFACKRAPTSPPANTPEAGATPAADAGTPGRTVTATGAIVAVPQRVVAIDPSEWRFDPSGRSVAGEVDDPDDPRGPLCGIWDLETGSFVRELVVSEIVDGELDPCTDWDSDPRANSASSANGQLHAMLAGELQIQLPDGSSREFQGCTSCGGVLAWAPSGHQIATCDGERLEIWDADTGARLHGERLDLQDTDDVLLGWSDEGIGVAVVHEIVAACDELEPDGDYCLYEGDDYDDDDDDEAGDDSSPQMSGYALSTFWWSAVGAKPIMQRELHRSSESLDVYADPGLRWVAFTDEVSYDRAGYTVTLSVLGTDGRTSDLGWVEDNTQAPETERWGGHWRVDVATQWIEGLTTTETDDGFYVMLTLGWDTVVAEPEPSVHTSTVVVIEGNEAEGEIEVWGAVGGTALAVWETCVAGEDDCKSGGPPVGDCELLDVSPTLSLSLVDCEDSLRLIEASGRGGLVAKLPYAADSTWQWGRGNYVALLEPEGKLAVVDLGTGKAVYERSDVLDLLVVPLAAEQDRLGLVYADHLEIVAGATGASVIDLRGDWSAAALSPDGASLAVLGNQQVQVLDIASKAAITSFAVGDAFGVAWRQDGAALFYGYDWPTHAVDPRTGALVAEIDQPIFDVFDLEEIDPSWRWVRRPDGSVTRTLDFARIELGPDWARVESGAFDGDLESLPSDLRFRVGPDPSALAIYTAKDLEPWLRSPGLVTAFFTGQPLPSPSVPPATKPTPTPNPNTGD